MAEYKFYCPQCGQHIQCDTGHAGMQIPCPACQQIVVVPPVSVATPIPPPPAPVYSPHPSTASAVGRPHPVTPVALPPVPVPSRTLQTVLMIFVAVVLLAGLGIGGWFGYSKIKLQLRHDPVPAIPNLLGYWRFSPDLPTKSSFGTESATFSGNVTVSPTGSGPDRAAPALLLDGNGSYVTTTLAGGLVNSGSNANQGSIIAWFKLANLPANTGRVFYLAGESAYGNDFDLQIEPGDNRIRFYTDSGSCTASTEPLKGDDINVWHFVAATFTSGDSRKIYLDGELVGSSTSGPHDPARGGTFSIGESTVFRGRFFQGALAEVAVFNRALSAPEIQAIYTAQK